SKLANQMLITLIVRMNSDISISKHGVGTCSGNLNGLVGSLDRILEVCDNTQLYLLGVTRDIKKSASLNLLVLDRQVRFGGVQLHTPVDQSVGSVDDSLLVKGDKSVGNCLGKILVQCESFPAPIVRSTHSLECSGNSLMIVLFPFPRSLHKLLSSKIVSCL